MSARSSPALSVLAVVALVAGGALWYGQRSPQPVASVPPSIVTTTVDSITVHVSGAVADPGLVSLPPDARVADAVAAAGGVLPGGDLGGLNLASGVADGDQVVVPGAGQGAGGAAPTPQGAVAEDGRVRINVADVQEMQRLPGIGPVLASRIVAHRQAHGAFRSVEDLLDVPGIGEGKLAGLRDFVVLP